MRIALMKRKKDNPKEKPRKARLPIEPSNEFLELIVESERKREELLGRKPRKRKDG